MVPIIGVPEDVSSIVRPARQTLDRVEAGAFAVIAEVAMEFAVKERLAALGLRQGRRVEVVRRMGRRGPIQVRTGATDILLRGGEAQRILVVPDPAGSHPRAPG